MLILAVYMTSSCYCPFCNVVRELAMVSQCLDTDNILNTYESSIIRQLKLKYHVQNKIFLVSECSNF